MGAYISAVIRQPPLPATRRLPAYLTPAAFLSHIEFLEVLPAHLAADFVDDWERLLFCCVLLQHNTINLPAWLGPLPAPVNKLLSEILLQCDPETGVWTNPFRDLETRVWAVPFWMVNDDVAVDAVKQISCGVAQQR
jgi:hypothetical protein